MARAVRELRRGRAVRVTGLSRVYRTSPVGVRPQPAFLNMAARVTTRTGPDALMRRLLSIERGLGRTRASDFRRTAKLGRRGSTGPRVIDLDLLLWGSLVRESRLATVPHPRLHHRKFALRPIVDVDPRAVHPALGVPLSRLLARVPAGQRVRVLARGDQRRFRRLLAGRAG
jgi:2-amino-4-hydroxy-6-hydroxymethyldihydropteridine diphosphokinase